MTKEQFEAACDATLALLKGRAGDFDARRDTERPTSPWHLAWMLSEAALFHDENRYEKANRWLGFVQGVMCTLSYATLDELKRANMPEGAEFDAKRV